MTGHKNSTKKIIALVGFVTLFVLGVLIAKTYDNNPTKQQSIVIENATVFQNVLKQNQIDASEKGDITQALALGDGKSLIINNEEVQVFEYDSPDSAELASHQITPDGYTINNIVYDWEKGPHFFLKDNVLVLYLGDNLNTINVLTEVLGPQIAGVESTGPGY